MIKGITQSGTYINVSGGSVSTPYITPGSAGAGMVRFNPNSSMFEVNDGVSWRQIDMAYASVGLTPMAEKILDWAYKKMSEECEFEKLGREHPAVQIALENLNKAKEQLKATIILSKDYEKTTS